MDIYHQQQDHQLYNYHNPSNYSSHSMINQFPLLQQQQQQNLNNTSQQQIPYMYHDVSSYPLLSQQQQLQQPPYQVMQQYQLSNQQQQLFPQWNSKFIATGSGLAPQEVPAPPQYQQPISIQQQADDDNSYMTRGQQQQHTLTKRSLGNVSPHSQRLSLSQAQPQPEDHFQMPSYNNSIPVSSPNSSRSLTYPIYGSQPMIPSNGLQFQSIDQQNLPPLRNNINSASSAGLMSVPGAIDLGVSAITPSQLSSVSSASSSSTGHIHVHHHKHSISKKHEKKRRNTIDGMSIETAARNRCPTCQKQFKRPSSLKTHMYSHTGEKPFVCLWEGCEKIFSVRSNMIRHLRLHEKRNSKSMEGKDSHFQYEDSQSPRGEEVEEDDGGELIQLHSVDHLNELEKSKY